MGTFIAILFLAYVIMLVVLGWDAGRMREDEK